MPPIPSSLQKLKAAATISKYANSYPICPVPRTQLPVWKEPAEFLLWTAPAKDYKLDNYNNLLIETEKLRRMKEEKHKRKEEEKWERMKEEKKKLKEEKIRKEEEKRKQKEEMRRRKEEEEEKRRKDLITCPQ